MIFGNRPVPADFKINVDGTEVPLSKSTKLLGVTLDSQYSWAAHISNVVNSCEKVINLIRRLCGFKWGAHPKQLMQIYYALIRSRLDYAAELFNSASSSQKKRLDAVQCKALRIILGLPGSTAAEVVLMEAGEKPLQLRRELASAKFLAKSNQLSSQCALNQEMVTWFNHPPESLIVQAKEFMAAASADSGTARLTYGSPPWSRRSDHIQTHQLTAFHSTKMTTPRPHQVETKWQDHLQVYTDGARAKDGRSSAAFVVPAAKVKQQHRIENKVSSLSCEKLAILLAAKWIESVRPAPQKAVIFTDSKKSVSDLQRPAGSIAEATVRTCRDIQAGGTEITVCWIPGHLGIAGNEAADGAAKSALSLPPSIGIHRELRDINYDLELHSLKMWQSKWNTPVTSSGKFYLRHTPSVLQRPSLQLNSRREQVILSRCRTNTLWLNHRRFKIGKHPNGHCSWCKVKEDVEHVLLECPQYAVERICTLTGIVDDNLQIDSILDTTNLTAQQATLDFLSSTGIAKRLLLEAKEGRDSPIISN